MFYFRNFAVVDFLGICQSLGFDCEQKMAAEDKAKAKDNHYALQQFLAGAEKRAYRMAQIATRQSDDAFDIVQDAMFKLVEKYAHKPAEEWGALFHSILHSRIRDWHRRSTVRNRFRVLLGFSNDEESQEDPFQTVEDTAELSPEQHLQSNENMQLLEAALQNLPFRQQQTFLLRAWEGLNVKETARIMRCSEGSIKTHYSRAKQALQKQLGELSI